MFFWGFHCWSHIKTLKYNASDHATWMHTVAEKSRCINSMSFWKCKAQFVCEFICEWQRWFEATTTDSAVGRSRETAKMWCGHVSRLLQIRYVKEIYDLLFVTSALQNASGHGIWMYTDPKTVGYINLWVFEITRLSLSSMMKRMWDDHDGLRARWLQRLDV